MINTVILLCMINFVKKTIFDRFGLSSEVVVRRLPEEKKATLNRLEDYKDKGELII